MLNLEETLSEKFIKKGSWIFLFTILTAPLGYIIRIVLTNDISTEEIGILYGIISLLLLLGVYNDFGLTESLNYFLPKYIVQKDYGRCKYLLSLAFGAQLLTSFIIGIGFFFLADFLAQWHFKSPIAADVIRIMSLFFLGANMMQVSSIIFSAAQNTKLLKGTEFFRMFVTMLGVCGLFFLDQGNLLSYAWVWIIGIYITVIFISILGYVYYYKPYFRGVPIQRDSQLRSNFIKYSLGTFVGANIGTLLHQLDQQILLNMTTSTDGGIYAMYLSLIGIPFLILTPLISFLFPVISEIYSRGMLEKIKTIHAIFSNFMSIVMLWASGLFIILGIQISLFLYGAGYQESGQALIFIAPFLMLNVLIQINFQIMAGTGMIRERVWILGKTLIFNITIIILLIHGYKNSYLPFPNAASATSFGVGFSWILMWWLSNRAIKKYRGVIDTFWILKNVLFIVVGTICYLYIKSTGLIPDFGAGGKLVYLLEILFVFLGSLGIFLLINKKKILEFIAIVKEVRNSKVQVPLQ